MLHPVNIEHVFYQDHPVIIATYTAQEYDVLDGHADVLGQTLYMGFYGSDLKDMQNLFFPGDRYGHPNREEVFSEIDRYGFDCNLIAKQEN